MVRIKHDDLCPCTRFYVQPEFCTCGAVECEQDINASLEAFGRRLQEINALYVSTSREGDDL